MVSSAPNPEFDSVHAQLIANMNGVLDELKLLRNELLLHRWLLGLVLALCSTNWR
jgi:hypothetical protein